MKRVGNLYNSMISYKRLEEVYAGVMKGKHRKNMPGSIAFMIRNNKEYYMHEAGRLLSERSFKPSKPKESYRYDKGSGKLRHIKAPKLFPDQFIHWSIVLALKDEVFLKGMDHWCCASVKGRGTLYAKNFIEKTLDDSNDEVKGSKAVKRKYKYCLKMDIKKFFDNIDRDILMNKLSRKVKDKEMLELCRKIIYSVSGTGIPLGYYTSQWFANFYLQDFDHWLREVAMPKYGVSIYVRYMDDMIILGSNKRKLRQLQEEIQNHLKANFKLELKNTSTVFAIADQDIDFIGFKFSYGKTTLRKKILHNMKLANHQLYKGKFTLEKLQKSNAYNGWGMNSDTKQYIAKYLNGNRKLENMKMAEMMNESRREYMASEDYAHTLKVEQDMKNIKVGEEHNNEHVLVRYYAVTDEVRIVARTKFVFPDYEEVMKEREQEKLDRAERKKEKKKKRKSRRKSDNYYYPTAEIYMSNRDKDEVIRDYNDRIKEHNELEERLFNEFYLPA